MYFSALGSRQGTPRKATTRQARSIGGLESVDGGGGGFQRPIVRRGARLAAVQAREARCGRAPAPLRNRLGMLRGRAVACALAGPQRRHVLPAGRGSELA